MSDERGVRCTDGYYMANGLVHRNIHEIAKLIIEEAGGDGLVGPDFKFCDYLTFDQAVFFLGVSKRTVSSRLDELKPLLDLRLAFVIDPQGLGIGLEGIWRMEGAYALMLGEAALYFPRPVRIERRYYFQRAALRAYRDRTRGVVPLP